MIVSQICETMIKMSQVNCLRVAGAVVLAAVVSGCCGGAPSHKCDFTPPTSQMDAGSDAPFRCGTEVCMAPQVCCLKKIAPFASCIDVGDYVKDDCEMIQKDPPSCLVPTDCDGGTVCCLQKTEQVINCQPPPLCPGDGVDTYYTCASDQDCPGQQSGSCTNLGSQGGYTLNVCAP
jgi:hypothetical protein